MITPKISYIKELVEPEHQLFHHRIQSCSYNLNRQELSKILIDNMIHHNGIGISANQIGIWERAFAMVRDLEHHEVMVCFNPRIVKSYAEDPFPYKVREKDAIQRHMEADEKLSTADMKIRYYEVTLKFLEEIIRNVSGRTYQIKNAIEWQKFQSGF